MAAPRKIKAIVEKVSIIDDQVRKLRLRPEKRIINKFKAGQFLHLAIDPFDPSFNWPESRVFSIATSPERAEEIELIISQKGLFTSRIFKEVKEGSEVWIKLPFGIFNFEQAQENDFVLVAGGTGISPFVSFLEYAIDKALKQKILLLYGVRSSNLLIIDDLLKEAKEKLENFEARVYLENVGDNDNLRGFRERMLPVNEAIQGALELNNPVFYLSGPPAMISAFDNGLQEAKVEPSRIKFDNWE